MRDYSKLTKYRRETPLDAQFHYAHDLFHRFCPNYGKAEPNPQCFGCPFPSMIGASDAQCCGWSLDANPEKAIRALESLLNIDYQPEHDALAAIRAMAQHNGLAHALDLMQEECAELIQAISKQRRNDSEDNREHVIEELADVSIMVDQLCELIPNGKYCLARWRDDKVERTVGRYDLQVAVERQVEEKTEGGANA